MGIITTAIKRGSAQPSLAEQAIESWRHSMTLRALPSWSQHGALRLQTDVTGFGLLGHLRELCEASSCRGCHRELDAVPVLEGVDELLAKGMWAGGSQVATSTRYGL